MLASQCQGLQHKLFEALWLSIPLRSPGNGCHILRQPVQGLWTLLLSLRFPKFEEIAISWKTNTILYTRQETLPLDSVFSLLSTICSLPERWHLLLCLQKPPIYWLFSDLYVCILNYTPIPGCLFRMFHRPRMSAIELSCLWNLPFYWIPPFNKWHHYCLSYRNSSVPLAVPSPVPSTFCQSSSLVNLLSNLYSLLFKVSKCLY